MNNRSKKICYNIVVLKNFSVANGIVRQDYGTDILCTSIKKTDGAGPSDRILLYLFLLSLLRTVHDLTVNDGNSRTYGCGYDSGADDGSRIDASILAPVGNDIYRD